MLERLDHCNSIACCAPRNKPKLYNSMRWCGYTVPKMKKPRRKEALYGLRTNSRILVSGARLLENVHL